MGKKFRFFSKASFFHFSMFLLFVSYLGVIEVLNNPYFDDTPAFEITEYGPRETVAGVSFGGQTKSSPAAIWFIAEGKLKESIVLVWGKKRLSTSINLDQKVISTTIPSDLYAKSGEYSLYLLDPDSGMRSNTVAFHVRDAR